MLRKKLLWWPIRAIRRIDRGYEVKFQPSLLDLFTQKLEGDANSYLDHSLIGFDSLAHK